MGELIHITGESTQEGLNTIGKGKCELEEGLGE